MINSKEKYKDYLNADLKAKNLTSWKWYFIFNKEILYFQRSLRKLEYYNNVRHDLLGKFNS